MAETIAFLARKNVEISRRLNDRVPRQQCSLSFGCIGIDVADAGAHDDAIAVGRLHRYAEVDQEIVRYAEGLCR